MQILFILQYVISKKLDTFLHFSCGIFIANFLRVVFYSTNVRYWPKKIEKISKYKQKIIFFKSLGYTFNIKLKLFAFYLKRSFIVIKSHGSKQMINPYAHQSNRDEGFESLSKFKTKYV